MPNGTRYLHGHVTGQSRWPECSAHSGTCSTDPFLMLGRPGVGPAHLRLVVVVGASAQGGGPRSSPHCGEWRMRAFRGTGRLTISSLSPGGRRHREGQSRVCDGHADTACFLLGRDEGLRLAAGVGCPSLGFGSPAGPLQDLWTQRRGTWARLRVGKVLPRGHSAHPGPCAEATLPP